MVEPSWISDNFPLYKLECQYFDICKYYEPSRCKYNQNCIAYMKLDGKYMRVRDVLRGLLEKYVEIEDLEFQIKLIKDSGEDEDNKDG